MSTGKVLVKHMFETMVVSQDRNVSLSAYKAVRQQVRGYKLTKRDIVAWLNIPSVRLEYVHLYRDGTKEVSIYASCYHAGRLIVVDDVYSGLIYKLAFKIISHKWDMTLSQIHEVENWSFPSTSRSNIGK